MRKTPNGIPPPSTKPFCDCRACANKDCTDILKVIPLPSERATKSRAKPCTPKPRKSSDIDSLSKQKPKRKKKSKGPQHPSITNMINEERDCACEVMARAVTNHVHRNLGISEYRDAINTGHYPPTPPDDELDVESKFFDPQPPNKT